MQAITEYLYRKILLITLFFSCGQFLIGQNNITGYWIGTMVREGSVMKVSFEFKGQDKVFNGYYNSPSQKASGIPLDQVLVVNDSVTFQLMSEPLTFFKCQAASGKISGKFIQQGFSDGIVSLKKAVPPARNYRAIDTSFTSGDARIACRIYLPDGKGRFPAVVFLHGSGGEGMFANQFFAEYFATKGIVTMIQDKRGAGKSTGNWQTAGFDDLATDHVNAVHFLKTFDKVNPKQIGIYGHSQGGTIAPLAASKSKDIAFVIAAAGVGDTVFKQDLYRTENNLESNGFNPSEVKEAMAYYRSWLDIAREGKGYEKIDSLHNVAKDKKWFGWVEIPPGDSWIWKYYLRTGNFNSLDYWKKVTVPVLLVYGEDDRIEDIRTYLQNIDAALVEQAGNTDVTQVILPKAQHSLCVFPGEKDKFFWWHLSAGYTDLVAGWILYRFKN